MKEAIHLANEELKRAEHLNYVSLKYTRTVDVIKSVVDRLIACFDYLIDGILEKKEEEGVIAQIPSTPFAKVEAIKKLFKDNTEMLHYMEFYSILRKISRAPFSAHSEFRRNVTLRSTLQEQQVEVDIDIISDYYHRTVDFIHFVNALAKK